MGFRLLFLLAAAHCVSTSAADNVGDAGHPFRLEDPQLWGTLSRIVAPKYPGEALERRQGASVDIDGVVHGSGKLLDVVYRPDSPASSSFVAALEEVVPYWLFHAPIGKDCQPTNGIVTTRVSFEVVGGEPKVFVTHAKQEGPPPPPQHMKALRRVNPRYPIAMLQRGWEAIVYAKLEVDPEGKMVDVKARAYSKPGKRSGDPQAFLKAVQSALMTWEFPPAPEGIKSSRFGCLEINFQMVR